MSVSSHKQGSVSLRIQVIAASSTRELASDRSGAYLADAVVAGGHTLAGRSVVNDEIAALRAAVREAIDGGAQAVLVTGGTGISARDVTPDALLGLFDRSLPGFGELFRMLSYAEVGSAAMLSRALAGFVNASGGPVPVFGVPGSEKACRLAWEKLIAPELAHLAGELQKERSNAATPAPAEGRAELAATPKPSGRVGRLGAARVELSQPEIASAPADVAEAEGPPSSGWKRAVWEVQGEVLFDAFDELPEALEKVSPVVDVLHKAGERAVLKLPSGRRYTLFGYPDLRRPGSKVIAIGAGDPLGEVVALHRFPVLTGVCAEGARGLVLGRDASVEQTAEAVTGRAPKDTSGVLYAVQGDAVWIQRGNKIIRWDGRKEFDDGSPKQVLASLVLHWSTR